MNYLLDTHVLIWMADNSARLSKNIRRLLEEEDGEIYISAISVWEVCQLIYTKRLSLKISAQEMVAVAERAISAKILKFDEQSAYWLQSLPSIHKDPFDRMLICQAIEHGLTFITDDRYIRQYPIKTVW